MPMISTLNPPETMSRLNMKYNYEKEYGDDSIIFFYSNMYSLNTY